MTRRKAKAYKVFAFCYNESGSFRPRRAGQGKGGKAVQDIPIVSFVAWSGTGKTTFLEKLIPALKARGLRLCVMKHDAHEFQADREGKDSWRMTRAGADVTIVTNGKHAAVFENRPVSAEALLARVEGVDLIQCRVRRALLIQDIQDDQMVSLTQSIRYAVECRK